MTPTPQPGIMDIALYEGGASHVEGANTVTKLSSNENPYGPSPLARDAYAAAGQTLELYPTTDHAALRNAIGEVHGLAPSQIICGAGSDEIIAFLCQAYAGPGTEVIHTQHGFLMYAISARAAGATPVVVPERDRVVDVDAILAAVTDATRLVFIANPANPTGTMIGTDALERLADGLPSEVILVLDGAYAEYVEASAYDAGRALASRCDNVVMTRTFSKIYGLGGLRIGFGFGPKPIIDVLNRLRGPFNISGPALAAAEAAVTDTEYTERCKRLNTQWRAYLTEEIQALGLAVDESHANFVLVRFKDTETALKVDAYLKLHGIIVRHVKSYGLPECLRITVGDEVACRAVVRRLAEVMA